MYIMCLCLFSNLSRRVGTLQISIIIINMIHNMRINQSLTWPIAHTSTSHLLDPQQTHESVIILTHNTHTNHWVSHYPDPHFIHQYQSLPICLDPQHIHPSVIILTHNTHIGHYLDPQHTSNSHHLDNPQHIPACIQSYIADPQHALIILYCWPTTNTHTHPHTPTQRSQHVLDL